MTEPAANKASQIDLHIHTSCSDGTLTPEQVVQQALAVGLKVIAIADHDATLGIEPAIRAAEGTGLEVVPAVEINTDYADTEVHVLGYFIDPEAAVLKSLLQNVHLARLERNRRILSNLASLGMHVSEDRVLEIAGAGTVCRPHLALAMLEAGYVASQLEAFDLYLGRGRAAYEPRYSLTPHEAAATIRAAGGIPVVAHPLKMRNDALITEMAAAGVGGLEAYHCDHKPSQVHRYLALARSLGMVVTGGTDSHGPGGPRPIEIGSVRVPDWVWPQLLAARR